MELLKTIGDFEITSEKIDNYKPDWLIPVSIIGIFGMGIGFMVISFSMFGLELPQDWKYANIILIFVFSTIFFATTITYENVCGISIRLKGTNVSYTSNFALSNDADRDAKKIKDVVDNYVKLANRISTERKSKDDEEKKLKLECCIRYNDVIEKVKQE